MKPVVICPTGCCVREVTFYVVSDMTMLLKLALQMKPTLVLAMEICPSSILSVMCPTPT